MKKTNKKGFTIVELVIVIAVIAILAAVLIPNISRLVKKANQSADESLVRNLNTALAMDAEKHTTMSAALKAAYENGGYDVAKIVTKNDDAKILWDSLNDCFVYLNGSDKVYLPNTKTVEVVNPWNYFEIFQEMPSEAELKNLEYSIYLAGTGKTVTATVSVGFDAGENTVASLKYENKGDKQDVILNTNGGTLEVDAEKDTVKHYGDSSIVTITAVATASYHENGTVGEIKLEAGRVVVEGKASVGSVLVTADSITETNKTKNVSVEVKGSATLGAVGSTKGLAGLKDVVSGTTEVIETEVDNNGFAGGFGTEKAPYLIADKTSFKLTKSGYYKITADIDASSNFATSVNSKVVLDLNGHAVKVYNGNGSSFPIKVNANGDLTLVDNIGGGKFYAETPYVKGVHDNGVIYVNGGIFTLESGTISTVIDDDPIHKGQFGVTFGSTNSSKIIINGGRIISGWFAVSGNGSNSNFKTELTVNGGELISTADYAIYNPQGGTADSQSVVTINGGKILGCAGAVSMNRGVLNINGGTLTSKGTGYTGTWGDGTGGDSNVVLSLTADYGDVVVNYKDGQLECEANSEVVNLNNKNKLIIDERFYEIIKAYILESEYDITPNGNVYTITKKQ